jgi:decaprenyl-phosphate phosphoribosyltransferase
MEPPAPSAPEQTPDQFRPVAGVPPPPPSVEAPLGAPDGPPGPPPADPTRPMEPVDRTRVLTAETAASAIPPAPTNPLNALNARVLLRAVRPNQWTKNVLVFAAPGAAGVLFHGRPFWHAIVAFALFCLVSSGTYLVNDTFDAEADRHHPVKRHRPVAAGLIGSRHAVAIGGGFMVAGVVLGLLLRAQLGLVIGIYCVLQLAYSAYLKHRPVYDLTCVAGGFVLRAIAGAVAVPVAISEWFLIVTTFGSLLLVTGKRLAEKSELGGEPSEHRLSLDAYSARFLRIVVGMSATGAIVGYALWAFGLQASAVAVRHHDGIFFQLSIVPVLLALLHFTMLIEQGRAARPEDVVLRDRELQVLGAVWLLLFALGVYG